MTQEGQKVTLNGPKGPKMGQKWPKMAPKKDSEYLPNSAIETQKTQKFWVNSETLTFVEALVMVLEFYKCYCISINDTKIL